MSAERIRELAHEHLEAENSRDLAAIDHTLDPRVEYHVMSPRYPDDPTPYQVDDGSESYLGLWTNLYESFESYHLVMDECIAIPERNLAVVFCTVTATPSVDIFGLPAGREYTCPTAAVMQFDDNGAMRAETAYGNLVAVSRGMRRMREFLAGEGDRQKVNETS
ncbi:nuclear transport factor 2 family protein [Amycolatopsis pithecellobii]|uniref:nuclear transport factor 2 family protein n=1 Tax=Amycolatopsis pithecellobii TaxID=664692 RepID=UPI00140CA973|nr:nuclear transport factor 2 family protein [Amycolatopsis pithecellobii]